MSNNESCRSGSATDESKNRTAQNKLNTFQISNKFDWILLVEAKPDVIFYNKFAPTFKKFDNTTSQEKNELDNDFDLITKRDEGIIREKIKKPEFKLNGKHRIIHLLKEKVKSLKTQHFYGIVDRDYDDINELIKNACGENDDSKRIRDKIKDRIRETDAHSLETMMIKYIGPSKFAENLTKTYEKFLKADLEKIVYFALKFSYRIGYLKKNKQIKLPYKEIQDYSEYVQFESRNFSFTFDDRGYLNRLIKIKDEDSRNMNKPNNKKYSVDYLLNTLTEGTSNWWKDPNRWFVYRGHDIVDFINALIQKSGKYDFKNDDKKKKLGTYKIIEKFDEGAKDRFESSDISRWLSEMKAVRENEKISPEDAKYRDYITAAAGDQLATSQQKASEHRKF